MSKEKTLRISEETEVMQATGVPAQETEEVSTALATEIIADLKKQLEEALELNRIELNKVLPAYSQITQVKLYPEEFEKTAKKSIKRFLYQ